MRNIASQDSFKMEDPQNENNMHFFKSLKHGSLYKVSERLEYCQKKASYMTSKNIEENV